MSSSSQGQQMKLMWKRWSIEQDHDLMLIPGFIIDHHDPSLFPERWIDLVVVLTCDNSILHDRLTER